jgi:hypothetical protein
MGLTAQSHRCAISRCPQRYIAEDASGHDRRGVCRDDNRDRFGEAGTMG